MPKLYCADFTCKYHGDNDKCMAEKVKMAYRNMATANEGRVDMLICRTYEESEFYKEVKRHIVENN